MFLDTQYTKAQLEMTFSRGNIEIARVRAVFFLMLPIVKNYWKHVKFVMF